MNRFFELIGEYTMILLVGFVIGLLFILKGYEKVVIATPYQHLRYVITGIVGSMFICWVGFEIFIFIGLPARLSVALGGLLAYLGADKIAMLFESFIQKKLGIKGE